MGFESQHADMKPAKHAYEVDFKVCSPHDIEAQQAKQVEDTSSLLEQPPEATAILFRYFRWNKERLIDKYMDNRDAVLEAAGLSEEAATKPARIEKVPGFVCDICCDDDPEETFAMKCGHRFCVDCWRQYLRTKIKDEGEAARIRCPGDGCNKIVDSKSLNLLITGDLKQRHADWLLL